MATWDDVKTFIHGKFKAEDVTDGMIRMVFDVGDLRSQLVFLTREALMDGAEEWLVITSPFAPCAGTDLQAALDAASKLVCGSLAQVGNHLALKHALPLTNVDHNEILRPIQLVTTSADRLERELVGTDAL